MTTTNGHTVRLALVGLGNVHRSLLRILESKAEVLAGRYGVGFSVVLAADRSGAIAQPNGFDLGRLRRWKEEGRRLVDLPAAARFGSALDGVTAVDVDLLCEASPVELTTGEPGLGVVRTALGKGIPCVLANKGPLVLAYQELIALAAARGATMAMSATVCGSLPVLNIGQRDLVAAEIHRISGIFNGTTNHILSQMAANRSYDAALAEAQALGIAETDPKLDVEGWDTANKLVIIANAILGQPTTLSDVRVEGILGVSAADLAAAAGQGKTIKLLATAERDGAGYRLAVAPTEIPAASFLGGCDGVEMGIEIESDIYGIHRYKSWERDALPTAAAMLRDAVRLVTDRDRSP